MSKQLFAGPWCGEFGWELFCWQGYVRANAHKYDRVFVAGRPGHEYLYEDFAYRYIPVEGISSITDCCRAEGYIYDNLHQKCVDPPYDWYPPGKYVVNYIPGEPVSHDFRSQEFRLLGTGDLPSELQHELNSLNIECSKYDIIVHARQTAKHGSDDGSRSDGCVNWSTDKWNTVCTMLSTHHGYRVAAMGSRDASYLPTGAHDIRGISLRGLAYILHNSRIAVGQSCGPMHFASLCGTPHIVWSYPRNRIRYEVDWNPFFTPVRFLDKWNWDPPVQEVINNIVEEAEC